MPCAILLQDAKELLLKAWPSSGWQTHSSCARTGTETTFATSELRASKNSAVDFAILFDMSTDAANGRARRVFE